MADELPASGRLCAVSVCVSFFCNCARDLRATCCRCVLLCVLVCACAVAVVVVDMWNSARRAKVRLSGSAKQTHNSNTTVLIVIRVRSRSHQQPLTHCAVMMPHYIDECVCVFNCGGVWAGCTIWSWRARKLRFAWYYQDIYTFTSNVMGALKVKAVYVTAYMYAT